MAICQSSCCNIVSTTLGLYRYIFCKSRIPWDICNYISALYTNTYVSGRVSYVLYCMVGAHAVPGDLKENKSSWLQLDIDDGQAVFGRSPGRYVADCA